MLLSIGSDDLTRSINPKTLQLGNVTAVELVARIAQAYEIKLPRQPVFDRFVQARSLVEAVPTKRE
jgi:hypothetical protein